MDEIESTMKTVARYGYEAAENGENLEDVLNNITVKDGEKA